MTDNTVYPVPEFLTGSKGAGWKITDARGGGAQMRPGILHVPLDQACGLCGKAHSHAIRNHEIAHAAITLDKNGRMPLLPPGLKNEYFQVVEDARIWEHIHRGNYRQHGSDREIEEDEHGRRRFVYDEDGEIVYINPPALCKAERVKWEAVYKGLDDKGRVLFACAAGRADWSLIGDIVEKCTPPEATLDAEAIMRIRNEMNSILTSGVGHSFSPPIRNTYKAAAWLQNLLEPPEESKDEDIDETAGSDPDDAETADEREEKGDSREVREADKEEAEREKEKHENWLRDEDGPGGKWCDWELDEPVLDRHLPGRLTARYQSSDEGAFIRRPDRLYVDQKVFGKKKRIQGGGVLIDDSGSMGLGLDEILAILEECPGATIGVYSTEGGTGTLRIVARDGKVVGDERLASTPGWGNGIDGPALEWLGQLPFTHKVWISDGQVTGRGDSMGSALVLERDILLRKYNIKMVDPNIVGRENLATCAVNALTGRQLLARKGA